jgi:signal transduction histidine kinase
LRAHGEGLEQLVERRTAALSSAYARLQAFDDLRRDFLRMIAHELRTPANGVLGVGELLLTLIPESDERQELAQLFETAGQRLRDVVEDATTIAELETRSAKGEVATPFRRLVEVVRAASPHLAAALELPPAFGEIALSGDLALLSRALEGTLQLAAALSKSGNVLGLQARDEAQCLVLRLELDELTLTESEVAGFLDLSSPVRGSSKAQGLGLAPVVARVILRSIGGDLTMAKGEGTNGSLLIALPKWAELSKEKAADAPSPATAT